MQSEFKFISEELRRQIEEYLLRVGLLCRVFARGKDSKSLLAKLSSQPAKYARGKKLVQDAIGIRIAFYFQEDIQLVKQLLCNKYVYDEASSTIDAPTTDQFAVSRYNLIFRIPEDQVPDMSRLVGSSPIDLAFEVQLRSILSEGWHEVEHDLRYKSKSHWDGQEDLSRALNGIVATLEASEWSMKRIFDDLAYRHYKNQNWGAMLHSKLRMRVAPTLSDGLKNLFKTAPETAKEAFRIDRALVIEALAHARPRIPITLDNLVFVWNFLSSKDERILQLMPRLIGDSLTPQN